MLLLVISIFAFELSNRAANDSKPKPVNMVLCTAPILEQAKIEKIAWGIIGRYIPTTSPFSIPCDFKARASAEI